MTTNRFVALTFAAIICTVATRFAAADTFGSGANTFDMKFVTIRNPGNAADTTGNPNPAGSVPYSYRIGKFEISEQMIDKANTIGGLFITKFNRGPDKPATSVSWFEAARFVNWLNTSSGSPPAYKFSVQPGDPNYTVGSPGDPNLLWSQSDPGYNPNNRFRNSLARYFLPSFDEWYKAAYYDPLSAVYYNYPTGSDVAPTSVASGTAAGTAVYTGQTGPADVTLAGGLSPFGTMAQGGNVLEMEETEFDLVNDNSFADRAVRGGQWGSIPSTLLASTRTSYAGGSAFNVGFRVASAIPEPSTLLLGALAGMGLLWRRRM